MPALATKPTTAPAPKPTPQKPTKPVKKEKPYVPPPEREIIYPRFRVHYYISGTDSNDWDDIPLEHRPGPITEAIAKQMLGWETQEEYTARCLANPDYRAKGPDGQVIEDANDDTLRESTLFSNNPDINVILIDHESNPVVCWNNNNNRPFRDNDCKKYVKTVLTKNWAGPLSWPEETINGETIIISRTANVESGQHRLIALILAVQIWRKSGGANGPWGKYWQEEPKLESLVVFGASDDPRVLMTIDNVIPRDGADTIYTSEVFRDIRPKDRSKMATMLDRGIDLVWKRTGMDVKDTSTTNARTNPETMGFLRSHPYLEKCVRRMFEEDKQKGISKLHISPGQCAGIMYLMASSATDPDAVTEYMQDIPRSEKYLTFQNKELAADFWRQLVKNNKKGEHPLGQALIQIPVDKDGAMARTEEKQAVICKGWRQFIEGEAMTVESCSLHRHDPLLPDDDYVMDAMQTFHLKGGFDFGGIDGGNKVKKIKKVVTPEEKAAAEEESRRVQTQKAQEAIERAKQNAAAKQASTKGLGAVPTEEQRRDSKLKLLRASHPGCILLFMTKDGAWTAYAEDATYLSDVLKPSVGVRDDGGILRTDIPPTRLDDVVGQITAKGKQVGLIERKEGKETIRKVGSPGTAAKPKPTNPTQPPPNPKPFTKPVTKLSTPTPVKTGAAKKPPLKGGIG